VTTALGVSVQVSSRSELQISRSTTVTLWLFDSRLVPATVDVVIFGLP
jgi:hypothetical protein